MSVASQFEVQKYTVSQKKTSTFYFWNNSVKNWRILMIFGRMNFEKIWHENLTELFISLVRCSHFTLENPKKSFSTVLFIDNSDYLRYLRKKQTVIHLPNPTWKCHHTNLWNAKLFHLIEGFMRSFKRWRLWREPIVRCRRWLWKEPVVMCGNWNVRQTVSQQVFSVTTFCHLLR